MMPLFMERALMHPPPLLVCIIDRRLQSMRFKKSTRPSHFTFISHALSSEFTPVSEESQGRSCDTAVYGVEIERTSTRSVMSNIICLPFQSRVEQMTARTRIRKQNNSWLAYESYKLFTQLSILFYKQIKPGDLDLQHS